MKTTTIAEVDGAYIYEIDRYEDHRGFFQEAYGPMKYWGFEAKQINVSQSNKGVLRGMHVTNFAKLCMCVKGKLFDVVADVRPDSPTYLGWYGIWLRPEEPKQLFIPSGCAHGFFAAEDGTLLLYMQNGSYDPKTEREVSYLDPKIGIDWPPCSEYIVSDKDREAKTLE